MQIVVAIDGSVSSTEVLDGPAVFYAEAIRAGQLLRFSPATQDGQPVEAAATVYFDFIPPESQEQEAGTGELIVVALTPDASDTHSRTTISEEELDTAAGQNFAETIADEPGVTVATGSSDSAKPIIRGQSERRLLILFDGTRHESQKWGPDHAPEIDLFSAGEITIIKGAAGVRYGPDAIGGVLIITPPPMRTEQGYGGKTLLSASSNGRRAYGALRLDASPEETSNVSYRIEGNASRGADLQAPSYVLGNTASTVWNLGASVEIRNNENEVCLSYQHHDYQAGIFYGTTSASPDEFVAQYEAGAPVTAQIWESTYDIDRPRQDVTHDRALIHSTNTPGAWLLETRYAFQRNHRQEFEQVREAIEGAQYNFTLRTHSLDLSAEHPSTYVGNGTFSGTLGLQGIYQENVYQGYSLIPNYRAFGGGIFAVEQYRLGRGILEAGARYDGLDRSVYMGSTDFARHETRETLEEGTCNDTGTAWQCPATYQTGSVSLGGLWQAVPDHVDLKLDLSSASRFPSADELYLIGYAPSFPVYALGAPNLGVETTWGASPTVGLRFGPVEAEISGYANLTRDFIYFSPELSSAGEPWYEVTIKGTWPLYTYRPIDALFTGFDGYLSIGDEAPVGLRLQGALVRATDRETGAFLIGTPPDQAGATLTARPPEATWLKEPSLSVRLDAVARQSRTDPRTDYVPSPEGYVLLGASTEASLPLRDRTLRVGLEGTNLLNRSYRDYTSLLRYYADQPGRDVRLWLGMDF